MESWRIKYYLALVLALIIFMYVFIFVAAPTQNLNICLLDAIFAAIVVFIANLYISSKMPEKAADVNRAILPQVILVLAIFSPIIILALNVKGILPQLLPGGLFIFQILLPGIILCAISFELARKRLSGPVNYIEATKYGALTVVGGAMGPLANAAAYTAGTATLTKDGKMTLGDSMLMRVVGASAIIAVFFMILILIVLVL